MTGKQQVVSVANPRWPIKTLADCIEKVKVPAKAPRTSFLGEGRFPVISQEADFINGYWNDEADLFKVAEPVVVFGDHTQVLKLVDFDFVVGADGVKILKPKHFLDAKFLRFYLEANPFPSLGYARHYRHISTLEVPLPPLDEQKRIVAVLDQAFAALDRARAHAEANLQDSNLLFKEILQRTIGGAFRRDQTNFSKCSLADALEVIRNGVNCDQKGGGRCKISRIESIATGSFNLDRVGYAELTESQKERARLLPGDILFSHINSVPHVGKTAVFDVDDDVYHGINLLLLRPCEGVLSGYMSWFLKALHATKYWEGVCKKSVNQASVNQKDIGKVPFFFPSTAKQFEVAQTLDDFSIQAANSRQAYIEKLSKIDTLRQSILQKAFAGELT